MKNLNRIIFITFLSTILAGCTEQIRAKTWGGSTNIKVEVNQKVVGATWKDANLWILTRPMREGETAETLIFKESSNLGMMEGTVVLTESTSYLDIKK